MSTNTLVTRSSPLLCRMLQLDCYATAGGGGCAAREFDRRVSERAALGAVAAFCQREECGERVVRQPRDACCVIPGDVRFGAMTKTSPSCIIYIAYLQDLFDVYGTLNLLAAVKYIQNPTYWNAVRQYTRKISPSQFSITTIPHIRSPRLSSIAPDCAIFCIGSVVQDHIWSFTAFNFQPISRSRECSFCTSLIDCILIIRRILGNADRHQVFDLLHSMHCQPNQYTLSWLQECNHIGATTDQQKTHAGGCLCLIRFNRLLPRITLLLALLLAVRPPHHIYLQPTLRTVV